MAAGTHWFCWSCSNPGGHWQPGTHILGPDPPSSSQLQPCWRSEQELPHTRPHSWYTWPPEHWTAGTRGGNKNCLVQVCILMIKHKVETSHDKLISSTTKIDKIYMRICILLRGIDKNTSVIIQEQSCTKETASSGKLA